MKLETEQNFNNDVVELFVKPPHPEVSLLGTGKLPVVIKLSEPNQIKREEGGQNR